MAGTRGTSTSALLVLLVLLTLAAPGFARAAAGPASSQQRPNVVVIVTDDQSLEQYRPDVMPLTTRLLGDSGTTFSQAVVSTPQCCPSRAAFYTGQYGHNNGVIANNPGYPLLTERGNVLPSWLSRAGYRTIHVGKFMNGYAEAYGFKTAPGWDSWFTLVSADYQNPNFSVDGHLTTPHKYLTDVINEESVDAIKRYAPKKKPFYLHIDQFAPHVGSGDETGRCAGGTIPSPADEDTFLDARSPDNPATMEADVSDKPLYIRRLPLGVSGPAREKTNLRYSCALQSLQDVDRGVRQVVAALRRSGELGNTMIAFVSDNGLAYGEHRVSNQKGLPYEEHIRVPMVVRPPASFPSRFRSGAVVDAPVANIDFAPSILKLAGADPCLSKERCRRLDGRSWLPLLKGRDPAWTADRAINIAFDINMRIHGLSCAWSGYRSTEEMVVVHTMVPSPVDHKTCEPAEEAEVYDLGDDPFETENVGTMTEDQADRRRGLDACSGIKGREKKLDGVPFCE